MTGTIVVCAEPPGLGRAGTFGVVIDGVRVGQIRQGHTARFPVTAGTHTVRVTAKDRTRSNAVTAEVIVGRDAQVTAHGTGLRVALVLPVLAGAAVPPIFAVATVLLFGAAFFAVPGLLTRVRVEADPEPLTPHAASPSTEESSGTGLWWESDPALAKRFQKGADS